MSNSPKGKYKAFVLVGAPGCGKGTQGAIMGAIPRFYHFSMGDAFRSLDTRTEIGQQFVSYSSKGELVPDELTIQYFKIQVDAWADLLMFKPDIDILILDGIPRNLKQAKLMEDHIEVLQLLHLSCPDRDELVKRLRKRALKEGRMDDASEEVILKRFQTYEEETRELLEYYSGIRTDINGIQPPVKVLDDILQAILSQPEWQRFVEAD